VGLEVGVGGVEPPGVNIKDHCMVSRLLRR
jgi:hypothetical protein